MTYELVKYTKTILAAEIHQTAKISESYITVEKNGGA